MKKYTCPCCGYKTLEEEPPGTYDICPICFWEDDGVQFDKPYYTGGANHISLVEAQKHYLNFGACEERLLQYVRRPSEDDEKDPQWQLFTDNLETRSEVVVIDLSNVKTVKELHYALKKGLCFPDFYGMNWDAFWDTVSGLVSMPKTLVFNGWLNIELNFPKESRILKELLVELNEEYPSLTCEVFYM